MKIGPFRLSIRYDNRLGIMRSIKIYIGCETKKFRDFKKKIRRFRENETIPQNRQDRPRVKDSD